MAKSLKYKLGITRLLIISSQMLLILFLSYWLKAQYKNEKEQLAERLELQARETQRQITDSLIMKKVVSPILKEKRSSQAYLRINMDLDNKVTGISADSLQRMKIHFDTSSHELTETIIYKDGDEVKNDLLVQGVRMIIRSTGDLPQKELKQFIDGDTALFINGFKKRLSQTSLAFPVKWVHENVKSSSNIYIRSFSPLSDQLVEVTGFSGYLLQNLVPQFCFVLLLLFITGLAFWFMYRNMREQMRLSVLKNDLVSNMSHELKTPVATVKVALEALGETEVLEDKATVHDYVEMATLEISRLELLINQALNTSLLEEGRLQVQPEILNMSILMHEVLRAMKLRFEQQHVQCTLKQEGVEFFAKGDRLHTQGVLFNILDNALKYAGNAASVSIVVHEKKDVIELVVSDNGPGIPKEYIGRVFDKFFRVPSGDKHDVKGYGLGLSYAAQVMRQQGGHIAVHNNTDGGCSFVLTFKKAKL